MLKAKPRTERKTRKTVTEEMKDEIIRRYNADEKVEDICKTVDVSSSTLYRVIRERSK